MPLSFWPDKPLSQSRGIADRIGCVNGKYCYLEFKRDSKAKISKLQLTMLLKANNAGAIARVVYPENGEDVFKEIEKVAYGKC